MKLESRGLLFSFMKRSSAKCRPLFSIRLANETNIDQCWVDGPIGGV